MGNKINKKIISIVIVSIIVIVTIASTWFYKKGKFISRPIGDLVEKILQSENISGCNIVKIADYKDIYVYLEIPEPTEEDIKEYIDGVLEDYQQEDLTEAFVKRNFQCDSIKEYKEKAAEEVVEQKKVSLIVDARSSVLDKLIENSKFVLDEECVSD